MRYARTANGRFRKARWWEIFAPTPKRDSRGRFRKAGPWDGREEAKWLLVALIAAVAIPLAFYAATAHR